MQRVRPRKLKPQGMSYKVMREKRESKFFQWMGVVIAIAGITITSLAGISSYLNYKRVELLGRQTALIDAPTWADFKTSGGMVETVLMQHADGVPFDLSINGEDWAVVLADHFNEAANTKVGDGVPNGKVGQTDCQHRVITYISHQNRRQLKETMLHEVFHAGACLHGDTAKWWNSTDEDKHEGIYHLAEFTSEFLIVNPDFVKFLQGP